MVKIFQKVAVEFSREVEIIGGGGQIVSGGGGGGVETFWGADGIISVVQSFFLWAFFCGWLCFLTKIYH